MESGHSDPEKRKGADFVGAMNMKLRAKYFDSGSSMFLGNDVIPR